LDPLFVKQIKVQQGAGAVIISLTLTNSTISGMKNVKVLSQRYIFILEKCILLGIVKFQNKVITGLAPSA